jgi:hypothetical protein
MSRGRWIDAVDKDAKSMLNSRTGEVRQRTDMLGGGGLKRQRP